MGLLDDFTRGLGLVGSAIQGDTAPLQAAASNTANNFNRGVQALAQNAPRNAANIANNFANDFQAGLGVIGNHPGALPGAILGSAGEMAAQPITSAQHLGEAIGNAASGHGTWDDALSAMPEAAAGALMATQLARGGAGLAGRLTSAAGSAAESPAAARLARYVTSDASAPSTLVRDPAQLYPARSGLLRALDQVAGPSEASPTIMRTAPAQAAEASPLIRQAQASNVQWPGAGTQFGDDLSFTGGSGGRFQIGGRDLPEGMIQAHATDAAGQRAFANFRPANGGWVAEEAFTPEALRGNNLMSAIYDAVTQNYGPIFRSQELSPAGAGFWEKALARAPAPRPGQ